MLSVPDKHVLVYQPNFYVRRGPPETCIQIVSQYGSAGLSTELMLVAAGAPLPPSISGEGALPPLFGKLPWKLVRGAGKRALDRQFIRRMRELDPARTIVDVWPGWPSPIVSEAKRLGFITVRNMINSTCIVSKNLLDHAYNRHGLPPVHNVPEKLVRAECAELPNYDFVVSPSEEVDRSLAVAGIPVERVLRSSFGWDPVRFATAVPVEKRSGVIRFLFVGSVGIRKGVPELLEAWKRAALSKAELLIIGNVEPSYKRSFAANLSSDVVHLPFSTNIGGYYKSADVFAFPTIEEGAPQVIYEAAGCGAAIITTPMGQARMIEPNVNGLVVPPGDVEALADAMRAIGTNEELRVRLKLAASQAARHFEYPLVGRRRGAMLRNLLDERLSVG